jgi:hypothetical protein
MRVTSRLAMVFGATVCLTVAVASAQSTSTSSETKQFEVIAVNGNDLVVRTPEGTRELTVPDDFRFTIDGKPVSVRELTPGMNGTATITTRTTMTPVTVTEVKDGTVAQVSASTIVVRTTDGLRSFSQGDVDKRGVKIIRDGKPAQLSDFRPGDRLSATIITSMAPAVVTEREVQATLAEPQPPSAPAAPELAVNVPSTSVAVGTSGSAAPSAGPAAGTLPKTAGPIPLTGLVGLASLVLGATLATRRRRLTR